MGEGLNLTRAYAQARAAGLDPEPAAADRLVLTLQITDRELCAELEQYEEGQPREAFALAALKIGVLALRHARGRIDVERIRDEGDRLLASLAEKLSTHQTTLVQQLTASLREYFDPASGRFNERIERLIRQDGELEQVLRRQVGADGSELVRTLASHIGANSPLMQVLDPQASDGLLTSIGQAVAATLAEQRERILREFSLDNREGALSRLVAEIRAGQSQASGSLAERIQTVVAEFSLDRDDSALSRLVRRVEQAQKQISSELSLDEGNSALARMRRELLAVIEALQKANASFQEQVLQRLTEASARREEARRSTRHGVDFEAGVFEAIEAACRAAGDIAEHTGSSTGLIKNCKKGDVVVTLGREHAAAGARIVIEAKADAGYDLRKLLGELDEARKNRDAGVGLAVLAAHTAPEGFAPLARHGDDVVVVWNPDDPASDVVLAAGLSVAKAICTRARARRDGEAADFQAIERAIRNIEKKAADLDEIATWVATISSNSAKITDKIRTMKDEFRRQITTLDQKVADLRTIVAS